MCANGQAMILQTLEPIDAFPNVKECRTFQNQLFVKCIWKFVQIVTLYSVRNSVSMRLKRRNSHDNSNAVRMGSGELKQINKSDLNSRIIKFEIGSNLRAISELDVNAR